MKLRTKTYLRRQKALRNFLDFSDIRSMLRASLELSRSLVVKKDIVKTLAEINCKFKAA
jgi:hypothetical protein